MDHLAGSPVLDMYVYNIKMIVLYDVDEIGTGTDYVYDIKELAPKKNWRGILTRLL